MFESAENLTFLEHLLEEEDTLKIISGIEGCPSKNQSDVRRSQRGSEVGILPFGFHRHKRGAASSRQRDGRPRSGASSLGGGKLN